MNSLVEQSDGVLLSATGTRTDRPDQPSQPGNAMDDPRQTIKTRVTARVKTPREERTGLPGLIRPWLLKTPATRPDKWL